MQIECRYFGPFREDTGVKSETRDTDAETCGDLLQELQADYPDLAGKIVDEDGLVGKVAVTRNKRNVRHEEGLDTPLSDGDVIRLSPSVYGG